MSLLVHTANFHNDVLVVCVQVQVSDDELMEWFRHIDHVLPHKRVALSELSCAEDGKQQTSHV